MPVLMAFDSCTEMPCFSPSFPFLCCEDLEGETWRNCVFFWHVTRCVLFCVLSLSLSLSLSSFFYTKKRNLDQQSQHSPVTNMAKVTALGNLQQAKKVMSNDFPNLSSINRWRNKKGMQDSEVAVPLRQGPQAAGECQGPQTKIKTPTASKNDSFSVRTLPTLHMSLPSTKHALSCIVQLPWYACWELMKIDESCSYISYNFWF